VRDLDGVIDFVGDRDPDFERLADLVEVNVGDLVELSLIVLVSVVVNVVVAVEVIENVRDGVDVRVTDGVWDSLVEKLVVLEFDLLLDADLDAVFVGVFDDELVLDCVDDLLDVRLGVACFDGEFEPVMEREDVNDLLVDRVVVAELVTEILEVFVSIVDCVTEFVFEGDSELVWVPRIVCVMEPDLLELAENELLADSLKVILVVLLIEFE
jgi:hypothetical protein